MEKLIKSPLNYVGGKFKILPQILPLFPKDVDYFIEPFCGGLNVMANFNGKINIASLPTRGCGSILSECNFGQ